MNKKTVVLAFGNPLVREDRLALEVCRELKKSRVLRRKGIRFVECTRPECLLEYAKPGNKVLVLDVVKGMREPAFVDASKLNPRKAVSAHSIDLGAFLKLARQAKLLKNDVRVIGLPSNSKNKLKLAKEVPQLLGP